MRYPPGKLPEIVDAYDRDGLFYAAIRLQRAGEDKVFELGISRTSYLALRRVLQTRPFDPMSGVPRRYFFVPSYSRNDVDPDRCSGTIRIEQGRDGKDFTFDLPQQLIANLLWFLEMKTLEPASHLRSWPPIGS